MLSTNEAGIIPAPGIIPAGPNAPGALSGPVTICSIAPFIIAPTPSLVASSPSFISLRIPSIPPAIRTSGPNMAAFIAKVMAFGSLSTDFLTGSVFWDFCIAASIIPGKLNIMGPAMAPPMPAFIMPPKMPPLALP